MREIKFRAWEVLDKSKKGGFMHEWVRIESADKGIIVTVPDNWDWIEVPKENLMQYTELKDKNGAEIYEGDIVSCDVYDTGTGEWHEQTKQVIFKDQQYVFLDGFWHLEPISSSWHSNLEVLGNIYENEELLNS